MTLRKLLLIGCVSLTLAGTPTMASAALPCQAIHVETCGGCHSSGADSACRMHCAEAQEAVRLSAAVPSPAHRLTAFPSDMVSGLPAYHVVSTGQGNRHLSPLSCTPHDPPEALYLINCTFRL